MELSTSLASSSCNDITIIWGCNHHMGSPNGWFIIGNPINQWRIEGYPYFIQALPAMPLAPLGCRGSPVTDRGDGNWYIRFDSCG